MENRAYTRMVEDVKERIGANEEPSVIEDVANHGADSGFSGFIYTLDCVEFYEQHKDVIWEMLRNDADNLGYHSVMHLVSHFNRAEMADTEDGFKNLLAWYALEEVCRQLEDEAIDDEDDEDE